MGYDRRAQARGGASSPRKGRGGNARGARVRGGDGLHARSGMGEAAAQGLAAALRRVSPSDFGKDLLFKEGLHILGLEGELLVVHRQADAVLTVAHAETAGHFHLVFQAVFFHQRLQASTIWREPLRWQELPMQMVIFMCFPPNILSARQRPGLNSMVAYTVIITQVRYKSQDEMQDMLYRK